MRAIIYIFIAVQVYTTAILVIEEQAHDKTKANLKAAMDTITLQGSVIDTYERRLMVNEIACEVK
jgi:hypothetical protein